MRRLLRILTSVATVLSLVLCVVTVVFWVRSYSYDDAFGWRYGTKGYRCASSTLGEVLFTQTGEWRGSGHPLIGYHRWIVSDFERVLGGPASLERRPPFNQFAESLSVGLQFPKRIQDRKLARLIQQRLVFVLAVKFDEA